MTELEELEAEVQRIREKKKKGMDREKLRKVLNVLFLVGATVGRSLYFFYYEPGERMPALYVIGASMLFKILEFVLRFTA